MSSTATLATVLQPVDWATIDTAIYDWIVALLGVSVIWENQNIAQPAYPYISLLRGPEIDEGGTDEMQERTIATDETIMVPGDGKTALNNEELAFQPVRFTLSLAAHVDFANGANNPGANAVWLLGKAKRNLGIRSTNDTLRAAGLSIVSRLDVQDTSVEVNGAWLSQASLDVVFRTASVMTERHSFIEQVEVKSTAHGVDLLVDGT